MNELEQCIRIHNREAAARLARRRNLRDWAMISLLALVLALMAAGFAFGQAPHVYLAVTGDPPTQELWLERSAPLAPLKLNGPLQTTEERGFVNSFAVSHDSRRVAYTANADATRPLDFQLYSVPITGPPATKLNTQLTSDYDVAVLLRFSEHDDRILFRIGRSSTGPWDLYSTPSAQCCGFKISHPGLPMGREVRADFKVLSGDLVRFSSDVALDDSYRWYVVPASGQCAIRGVIHFGVECILTELFADGFETGTTGGWS